MSDSFADLWSSSAPLPPKPKPQTLSSASSSSLSGSSRPGLSNARTNSNTKPDVFAMLSSSGTSTPVSRYGSGSSFSGTSSSSSNNTLNVGRPSNPPSRTMTPSTSSQPSTSSLSTGDAFSDLFASSSSNSTSASNMTLAARLAMEAEQRRRGSGSSSPAISQARQKSGSGAGNGDAWAGLDSLGFGPSSSSSSIAGSGKPVLGVKIDEEDDWGLGDFGTAKPATTAKVESTRQQQQRQPPVRKHTATTAKSIAEAVEKKKGVSLWDLDEFSAPTTTATTTTSEASIPVLSQDSRPPAYSEKQPKSSTHGAFLDDEDDLNVNSPDMDFDFGSREDQDRTPSRHSGRQPGKGLLDLDGKDGEDGGEGHGYQADDYRRGIGRGLLDGDDDDDGPGFGYSSTRARPGKERREGRGEDEDDILGMLSKPVEVVRAKVDVESTNQRGRNNGTHEQKQPRTSSPPPHILGQIVEMGFSITQAKKALSATKNGQDVEAALESLLGGGSGGGSESTLDRVNGSGSDRPPPSSMSQQPAPPPSRTRGAPKGQKERERERLERQRQLGSPDNGGVSSSVAEMQEQADKLLAQASEIGLSVFSKASAFWKEGKEKVVKAYEERTTEVSSLPSRGSSRAGGAGGSRPKWMQEVHASDNEDDRGQRESGFKDTHGHGAGFQDDHDHNLSAEYAVEAKPAEREVDLFAVHGESTQQYRKPSPRPTQPPIRHASSSSSMNHASSSQNQVPPRRTIPVAQPPPLVPTRNLVTASPSALAAAQKHKTLGTEQFKLGQHGPAAESYTSAISALPTDHILLIPLHTNRALARLKTGEYGGAITDCQKAVEGIIGKPIFGNGNADASNVFGIEDPLAAKANSASSPPPPLLQPSIIPPNLIAAGRSRANGGGWSHPQGVGVDLLDSYVKALRRAAEAFEGREKWVEACAWWGILSQAGEGDGAGWVDEKARKEAVVGGVRCRKMVDGSGGGVGSNATSTSAAKAPASKPRAKPKPRPAVTSTEPSRALQALQSSNAQAEADDAAKHALKDSVDSRLLAWKGGKETNIRALLASLDTVLWEGANGVQGLKMGMADLVSAGQVKKGYMKAIARVHPDKLNAGNSTLEQRMLANGVFGGLNEAWIAFQATQK